MEKRIKKEIKRLSAYFADAEEERLQAAVPLIENCAFMRCTLEDLAQIVAKDGPIETYQNGENQTGVKQSAALQSYNQTMKTYLNCMKQLLQILPPQQKKHAELQLAKRAPDITVEDEKTKQKAIQMQIKRVSVLQERQRNGEISNDEFWQLVHADKELFERDKLEYIQAAK